MKFPKEYEEIRKAKLPEQYVLSACRFFNETLVVTAKKDIADSFSNSNTVVKESFTTYNRKKLYDAIMKEISIIVKRKLERL